MTEPLLGTLDVEPAPSWVDQLHELMVAIGRQYPDATIERQRRLAGAAVAQLVSATADLGVFRGDAAPAQDALLNILMMIGDLEAGRRHRWAVPISVGGTNTETQLTRELRLWAIVGVTLLRDAGTPVVSAYNGVAARLTAAGYPITAGGVKTWFRRHANLPRRQDTARLKETLPRLAKRGSSPVHLARSYLADEEGLLPDLISRFQS